MNGLRRSRFYVAAHQREKILEALNSGTDAIIFDLEDLVPVDKKETARRLTKETLANPNYETIEMMIRVNNYSTPFTALDLELLTKRVTTVLFPKAESSEEIKKLDEDISKCEALLGLEIGTIGIHPAIESALGLLKAYEIASSCSRVTAISIGASDFIKDIRGVKSKTGIETFYAKSHLVLAARAAGVQALDTVYPREDVEGLVRETEESFTLGFDGKGVIRAEQIPIIHEIYAKMKDNK